MRRVAMLLVAALLLASCSAQGHKVGKMQNKSSSVPPENAKSVRAHLVMKAGELKVSGAADELMEADFS